MGLAETQRGFTPLQGDDMNKATEERKQPKYLSQEGFQEVPILRGFTEVEHLYYDMLSFNGTVCGGYVRWMCSPADVPVIAGDVDVYFVSEDDYLNARRFLKGRGLSVKHENEISVTFHRARLSYPACPDIQLIKPIAEGRVVTVGDTEGVLENFDFTVVRAALTGSRSALVDMDFLHDENRKILRLKNIHCPVGSTMRCMKYSKKGYWLPPTQALKLFFDWDDRTDEYKDQLVQFVTQANEGEGLTQKEIDQMEKMMRID